MPKKSWRAGTRKAYSAMGNTYGSKKRDRIFYAMANKYGTRGKTMTQKVNQVFKKGARRRKRK